MGMEPESFSRRTDKRVFQRSTFENQITETSNYLILLLFSAVKSNSDHLVLLSLSLVFYSESTKIYILSKNNTGIPAEYKTEFRAPIFIYIYIICKM